MSRIRKVLESINESNDLVKISVSDARLIYEYRNGECFDKNGKAIVLVSTPDNSGVSYEHDDGIRGFIKISDIRIKKSIIDYLRTTFGKSDI